MTASRSRLTGLSTGRAPRGGARPQCRRSLWPPTPPAGQFLNALLVTDNPLMDVGVAGSPKDINGAGSDVTDFARTYVTGTRVTLTAPATADKRKR